MPETRISRTDQFYRLSYIIDSRLNKRDQIITAEPVTVELFDGRSVRIPSGFITDFHSTPSLLDGVLPHYDTKTNLAAKVHDFLYMEWETSGLVTAGPFELESEPVGSRARAYSDRAYYCLMEQFNPGGFRNRLYYWGVRAFGGWNWRRFRERNKR